MFLEKINSPADVKKLSGKEFDVLAGEIRSALMNRLTKHEGHFGPNFGFVEATIALHYVFNSPRDKFIFDVSHQCYPHKILTGRKEAFTDEAHFDDISGYTNPDESDHDLFTVGHTSTSVSLACGVARGRDSLNEDYNVVAIIGDGSLSGGEALEGLDSAGEMESNLIIIVNDNDMSIAENHGGLYKNLKELRESNGKCAENLFKAMGLDYIYVNNGNCTQDLIEAFSRVKDTKKPVVVHINTLKGKGYRIAEENKEQWHWSNPFDADTGKPLVSYGSGESYVSVAFNYLTKKMDQDKAVTVITSGTPTIMGFTKEFREKYKNQFIDVGIAEETAVALASGMARVGGKPVYGVYSSFIHL